MVPFPVLFALALAGASLPGPGASLPWTGPSAQALGTPAAVPVPEAQEVLPDVAVPPTPEAWRGLLQRDKTVQFTARTPSEARAVLGAEGISAQRRAAALMALGCASAEGERGRLETLARTGQGIERVASILALGEMNAGATALLLDIAGTETGLLRDAALLALLRDGRNAGRRRVEEIAADPSHPAALGARDLLVQAFDPAASRPTAAGSVLLRLRWEAAREFGLVEGQAWKVLAIRELSAAPDLLAEVVMGALPGLRRPGVADHLLNQVLHGRGTARLRAAVAVIPRELSDLVANDLWRPADVAEWRAILDEIDRRRVERLAVDLVRAAIEVPEVRWRAVELAGLAGEESSGPLLAVDPSQLDAQGREQLAVALGAVPDASWLTRFATLAQDPDPAVRAAFRVAALRHDQRKPTAEVEERATDPDHPEHRPTIRALLRVARDPRAGVVLESRFGESSGEEKVAIATGLCGVGRLAGRATVREALSSDPPPRGADAVELVRALARNGSSEDVEVFRALFPRPDDRELDVELARALAEIGDSAVEPLLRSAIWNSEFDVSVLAVGLLFDHGGPFALLRELQDPPISAASSDLRRVGFAVGQWGGPAEYERLLRELRATSAHPAVQGAWLGALASRTR
ncbi:MAG: hypothetical protein NTY35_15010 [Planctomycetota bacterium]|nr:hypothetical protein [Planctomycetota bacterium]